MRTEQAPMSTPTNAPALDPAVTGPDIRNLEKVRGIFAAMAKFVSAQAIYQSNNPNLINFARSFEQAFRSYFEGDSQLLLTVRQYQLVWREQVVYDVGCNTESIAFLLYKDGIGEIAIHSTVKKEELEQFAGILKNALYNPSAQFDTATALWHAEFPNIFYRVLDEQSDGAEGDGDSSGSSGKEQPLRADDHMDIDPADTPRTAGRHSDATLETLGAYLAAVADNDCRETDPAAREQCFQRVLSEHFAIDTDVLARWKSATRATEETDDLIAFLRIMFDFTRERCAAPVVRDVTDTIDRLVHYIHDEGHVSTLIATLELQAHLDPDMLATGFASLPERIEEELTDIEYLISLGKGSRVNNSPGDVLRYLHLVGGKSVPAVCELLARSTDPVLHEKGCEILIDIAGADVLRIVETLDIENPFLAQDVVHLMARSSLKDIPPVIDRMLASPDANVRRCVIGYLVQLASDEAAKRLAALLKDDHQAIRIRTLDSVVGFAHPLLVAEVGEISFSEQSVLKHADELEHLFRALGKLAGESALPRLRQTARRHGAALHSRRPRPRSSRQTLHRQRHARPHQGAARAQAIEHARDDKGQR
jgi:hypothetical protein